MKTAKTENFYTISIGGFSNRCIKSHNTKKSAQIWAEERNQYIIDNLFGGNRDAWSNDSNSLEYIVLSETEMKADYPDLLIN